MPHLYACYELRIPRKKCNIKPDRNNTYIGVDKHRYRCYYTDSKYFLKNSVECERSIHMATIIAKRFLSAKDISLYMGVSLSMAYRIIRQLNEELSESGYITVAGRVSRSYFEEKTYMNKGREYVSL